MEVGLRMENLIGFDETELRLWSPGGGEVVKNNMAAAVNNKRGFAETESVNLKLNLSSKENMCVKGKEKEKEKEKTSNLETAKENDAVKSPVKAQVMGWPPVRSSRKNILAVEKSNAEESDKASGGINATFVKVSMDGAPYLRKVDLNTYKSYQELSAALGKMFCSFTNGPTFEGADWNG